MMIYEYDDNGNLVDSYELTEDDVYEYVEMFKEVLPPYESMSFDEWIKYLGNEIINYAKDKQLSTREYIL